jgi:DNA polymerase-3 subunit alpha
MKNKTFPCGCSFNEDDNGKIMFDVDINHLNLDCPATWDLICDGNTKGVFQLESQLGQSKSREVKPRNMEELSDLIAIIRPGTMDSFIDGKSLTKHYIDRKHKREDVEFLDDALIPILKPTQGILVYQEQALQIAKDIAGFTMAEAELLRKAIGKKKVELMKQIKTEFVEKCESKGVVTKDIAEEIFRWIEASQRYSFNKSHSVSYAYNAYMSAYAKAHFPRAFFTSYLRHADGKPKPFEEINELVNNCRLMDIDVLPPSIWRMTEQFELIDNCPAFGLVNIKGVGKSVLNSLIPKLKTIDIKTINWDRFLVMFGFIIKKDSFCSMIKAGAFDCYNESRNKMLYDFDMYCSIPDSVKKAIKDSNQKNFIMAIKEYINSLREKPVNSIVQKKIDKLTEIIELTLNPPFSLEDSNSWKAKQERDLLGIELTCTELDDYDMSAANCTCKNFRKGFNEKAVSIAVKINDVREWEIKSGKNKGNKMCFLKVSDLSCYLDGVTIFTDEYEKHKHLLNNDSCVLIRGYRDDKTNSFIIKRIEEMDKII